MFTESLSRAQLCLRADLHEPAVGRGGAAENMHECVERNQRLDRSCSAQQRKENEQLVGASGQRN